MKLNSSLRDSKASPSLFQGIAIQNVPIYGLSSQLPCAPKSNHFMFMVFKSLRPPRMARSGASF